MNKFDVISFGRAKVNVIRGDSADVEKVCLNDICFILRKPQYLNGKAQEICHSLIEEKGKLYASIPDTKELVSRVRKSKHQKQVVQKLIQFLNSISHQVSVAPRINEDDIIPVVYRDNEFKAKTIGGRLMFNVTEMAKTYDKAPYEWLNLATTKALMQSIVAEGKAPNTDCLFISSKGRGGQTWLDSTLLIEFGRWLAPEFAIWCDEVLMKLLNEGSVSLMDVNPQKMRHERIQRHSQPFLPPATMNEALMLCQEQHEFIQEVLPKIEYFEEQVEKREWFPNSFVANELGISIRALNSFLEKESVQVKKSGKWVLTDEYKGIPLKTDVPYDNIFASNPHNMRNVWTHYGREYIHELWKLRNE